MMNSSDQDDRDNARASSPASAAEGCAHELADETALPREVQEHLGRQLRSALRTPADRPAYLGDPGTPSQFDGLIARIAVRERVHERAVQAVERALDDLGERSAGGRPDTDPRPRSTEEPDA